MVALTQQVQNMYHGSLLARPAAEDRQTDMDTRYGATNGHDQPCLYVCIIFVCCIDVYLYVHVYLYDEVVNAVEMNSPHVRKLCTNTFMNLQ